MLSSSSYGKYREGNHANKRLVADVLEDESYKIGRSKVSGMSVHRTPKKAVKDDVQCDDGALFPSIPYFDVDDRVHNALLEELCADYGVTDSSDLDLLTFDLPSSELHLTNLQENKLPLGDVSKRQQSEKSEEIGYADHKSCETIDMSKAVASPTISSSSEETHLSQNVDNCLSEINKTSVHSSTNNCAGAGATEDKKYGKRPFTPEHDKAESFEVGRKSSDEASKTAIMKRELELSNTKSNLSGNATDDGNSVASSPDEVHIAKKARTISNGDDLLKDVKKSYEFVRGATIFNPAVSHQLSTQSFWPQPFVNNKHIGTRHMIGMSSCDSSDLSQSGSSDCNKKMEAFHNAQSSNVIRGSVNRCDSADVGLSHRYAEIPNKGDYSAGWTGSGLPTVQGLNSRYVQNYRPVDAYGNIDTKDSIIDHQPVCNPTLLQQHSSDRNELTYMSRKPSDNSKCDQAWYSSSGGLSRSVCHSDERICNVYYNETETSHCRAQFESHGQSTASQQLQNWHRGYSDVHHSSAYNQHNNIEFTNRHHVDSQIGVCESNQSAKQIPSGGFSGMLQLTRVGAIDLPSSPSLGRRQVLQSGSTDSYSNVCSYPAVDSHSAYTSDFTKDVHRNNNADRIGSTTAQTNSCLPISHDRISFADNSSSQSSLGTHKMFAGYRPNSLQRLNYPTGDVRCINDSRIPGSTMSAPSAHDQSLRVPFVNTVSLTDQSCQGFVRHLVGDGSSPYRMHPLFPLLRDLVIADMNFDAPSFPFSLLAGIPKSFDRLVDNFFSSNRQATTRLGIDPSMDGIIIDALRFAHSSLIDKIQCQRLKDGFQEVALLPVEDVCSRFSQFGQHASEQARFSSFKDRLAIHGSWAPAAPSVNESLADMFFANKESRGASTGPFMPQLGINSHLARGLDHPVADTVLKPQHYNNNCSASVYSHQMASTGIGGSHQKQQSQLNYDYVSSISEGSDSINGSEKANKNKVLPNESKAIMVDWLRAHQENPYPNDDEKEELMSSTKLTISQINYWFTNARRRLLPKWAMQRRHAFERDSEQHTSIPIQ